MEARVKHVSNRSEERVLIPDEGAGAYTREEEVGICEEEDADAGGVHAVPEELGFLERCLLGEV